MQILDKLHSMLRGTTGTMRTSIRAPMVVESMEPRILHSADPASVFAGGAPPAAQVEQRVLAPESVPAPAPAAQTEQTHSQELVFVDPRTPNYQQLVNNIRAEAADGRDIKIILLDSQSDGVAQITAYLCRCKDISAIHIISHGSDGTVQIGSALLDTQTLGGYESELHNWSAALAPGADLLIYGCDVAETAGGRGFVDALGHATGTNVAASENLTGNAKLGGDWNLEYISGPIEASVAIDAQTQAQYAGVLAISVGNTSSSMTTGASSLTFAQTIASGANGLLVVNVSFQAGGSNAVTSVTYGGTALTLIGSAQNTTGAHTATEMWVLKSPAAGTANVVISMNASLAFTGGATNFFGVDQTTPTGTFVGASANNHTPSVTVGSAPGELVIDSLAERSASSGTAGAGQTERYHQNTGTGGGDTWGSSSTETGAASVVMNWSTVGSGNGEWAMGAVSLKPAINNAPSLAGANNLTTLNEDPGSNPGTLVSALISGMVTDADAGALSGIAVTAVDNTNGTWQYSTDGGGSWVAFGTPSATSARLLAADASSTYVRFAPNANWNGTVTNGLTFRAWDQTSGVNGGTADTSSVTNTVLDQFNAVSYNNNDGTASWSAGWVDTDGSPSSGSISVTGGQLNLATLLGSDSIYREANLSGATSATLSFSYNNQLGLLGTVALQASNNGGGSYTTLASFSNVSNTGAGTFSADISSYIASNTRIRLVMNGTLLGGSMQVDNVQISYATPLNGGNTAFSAATASSSITVSALNDAPTLSAPAATAVTEDVASAITGISFSDVDAGGANVVATFSVPQGTLAAVPAGGVTVGGSTSALTLTGSIANINAFIAGSNLSYTTAPNDTSAVTLGVSVNDLGNTGSGGALSAAGSVTLNVTAVNDAPVNSVPGAQNTAMNTAVIFSSGNGNAISVGDVDAGSNPIQMTLAVPDGTLTLAGTSGLTFSVGTGTGNASMTFSGAIVDINAALEGLRYDPTSGFTGSDGLSITADDLGNSGAGGPKSVTNTIVINVAFVNSAPVLSGANNLSAINEDPPTNLGTSVSALIAGYVSDANAGALSGIAVTAVDNTNGNWQYSTDSGSTWIGFSTPSVSSARLLAADGNTYVRFVPNANWNGTVTNGLIFRAWDQTSGATGGTADTTLNGGSTAFSSATASSNSIVNSVNDAPAGANNTVSTPEDTGYVFASTDFGFSDPIDSPPNALLAVRITTVPGAGTLTLSGTAVSAGQFVSVTDINAGNLVFTPALNANGSGYASFTFQVQDNGGTASGGIDLDPVARTMSIDVSALNDAPTLSAPAATAVTEDVASAITGISFSDVDAGGANVVATFSVPQGTLAAVPAGGVTVGGSTSALTLTGSIANINAFIAGSNLSYTTAPNDTSAVTLGVSVNDLGNTGSGGALSAAGSVTLNVTAVNDAPAGANNTVSTPEDTGYVFASTDFGFSDPSDSPPNALLAVKITTVPGAGTLTLSGTAVSAGQFVSVTDINAGNLVFTPALNANGSGYASFTFQVQDNGGTANGGVDLDPVARTMSINVSAVNDAPIAVVPGPQSTATNATLVFSTAGGNAISIGDPDAGASAVQVSLSIANGTLTLAGTAGLAFTTGTGTGDGAMKFTGTIAAINTALDGLAFTPTDGYSGGTVLSLTVNDLGNTGSGGALTAGGNVMIAVALPPPAIMPPAGGSAIVISPPGPPVVITPALPDQGGPSAISPEAPAVTPTPQAPGATESAPAQAEDTASTLAGDSTSVARASQNVMPAPDSGQTTHSGRGSNVAFGGRDIRLLLATSEQPEVALNDFALTSRDTPYATQIALAALRSTDLLNELDRLREGLQEESTSEAHAVALTTAATLGLSVGYVFWLLRGGVLLSTLLSSMPAWRLVDPLPILGRLEDDDDEAGDADESLESLVARQNRAGGGEQSEPEPA